MNDQQRGTGIASVPQTTQTTHIAVTAIMPNNILVSYNGLMGNTPAMCSNFVAVYQASQFPFGTTDPPLAKVDINTNIPGGEILVPFNLIREMPYVVGYGVSPMMPAPAQPFGCVCSTVTIPGTGDRSIAFAPSLSLLEVGHNSIVGEFILPPGITPGANGAWVGLWMGNNPSYTYPPGYTVQLNTESSTGNFIFTNLPVMRGTLYSIGLFMNGWGSMPAQTAMAATLQFAT